MGDKQINLRVSDRVHENLSKMARERGSTVTGFAQQLFEAAYAARVTPGGTGDEDLDGSVARSVLLYANGQDTARIAHLVGLQEKTVERILSVWRQELGRVFV